MRRNGAGPRGNMKTGRTVEEKWGEWRSTVQQTHSEVGGGAEASQVKGNNGEIRSAKDVITQGNKCWRGVMWTGQYSRDSQREYWKRGGAPLTDTSLEILKTHYEKKLESWKIIITSPQEDAENEPIPKHNERK